MVEESLWKVSSKEKRYNLISDFWGAKIEYFMWIEKSSVNCRLLWFQRTQESRGHIIRGVLVSTVNSCPTFLSWGWWCTKGKGKVNRCCAKSPKKKQHIPAHRLLIIGSFVLISLSYDFFLQDIRNQKKNQWYERRYDRWFHKRFAN